MKENEKIVLKRTKSIGVHLDRLKPNVLYPGPNDNDEDNDVVEKEITLPEVDLEKAQEVVAQKAKEAEEARKAQEEAAQKAREAEEARKAQEVVAQKAKEAEEARKAQEEAAQKAREAEEARKAQKEAAQKAREAEEARKAQEEAAQKTRKIAEEKARMEELQRQQVSATEVKSIVSDETAQALIEQEEETEKVYGNKKAIINLDVISAHFEAGEIVTVNTLKEKKLISNNVYFVKILARGVLDKPLVVKAQDFSIDAAKMIELTGGRVVMLTKKKYF